MTLQIGRYRRDPPGHSCLRRTQILSGVLSRKCECAARQQETALATARNDSFGVVCCPGGGIMLGLLLRITFWNSSAHVISLYL